MARPLLDLPLNSDGSLKINISVLLVCVGFFGIFSSSSPICDEYITSTIVDDSSSPRPPLRRRFLLRLLYAASSLAAVLVGLVTLAMDADVDEHGGCAASTGLCAIKFTLLYLNLFARVLVNLFT